ncbi:MAG TPA: TonB-dependent receptor [Opitutaceae bacterium]|nr:TonB-dependent receptor [Opitutaceae bacterium]
MNATLSGLRGRGYLRLIVSLVGAWLVAKTSPVLSGQPSTGALTGSVCEAATGKFLEGADVSVSGTSLRASTTREGIFTLRDVPAGARNLVVAYPGLETKTIPVDVGPAQPPLAVRLASEVIQLETVRVRGTKEGMAQAVALQRASVQFKLVAAADQFGEISEGNVGEYLKFLPGISIDYNVNDARGISLRGLSTSFTIVAVDGTPMAGGSSTDDTRRFEFEQIAMNNVETTELYKTVTPDIPASSTGGYVNFVTKSAFDSEAASRFTYNITFSAPSTNLALTPQGGVWGHHREYTIRPSAEFNYARRIGEKLGLNFNYRLSEKYDDSPRTEITWVTTATAPTVMTTPRLQQYNIRLEEKLTHREAFATKIDYRFTPQSRLMVSGQWNWYDLPFTQRGPSFVLGTASTASGDSYTSGTGRAVNNGVLMREKFGTTWHFNGRFTHEWDTGRFSVTPYWSRADSKYRDTQKGFISGTAALTSSAYTGFTLSNVRSQRLPDIAIVSGTNPVALDYLRSLGNYTLSNTATGTNFQSRPWTAIDYKRGIAGDYAQQVDGLPMAVTVQTGYALDRINRSIGRPDLRGVIPATTGGALSLLGDPLFAKDVAYGFGRYEVLDPYQVWSTFSNRLTAINADLFRKFDEKNDAAFVRLDLKPNPEVLVVTGVRWEKRSIAATGSNRTSTRSALATVNLKYDEWYPSAQVKYTPRRELVLRAGVSRTVGHPDYIDLLPTVTIESSPGAGDGSIGVPDPHLKPYFTRNYDVSADYYLPHSGVISASVFRKDVQNFIVSRAMTAAQITAIAQDYGYSPALFNSGTVATNGGSSRLQGCEIAYAQQFPFLPSPFNGLNLQVNGTYLDVSASDIDTEYSQLRAVSPKTYNVVLGYKYRRWSFTSTTNWVDDALYGGFVNTNFFVGTANPTNPALDTRLALYKGDKVTTDMKLEYGFSEHFSAYLLVRNVFNSPRKEYMRGYLPEYRSVMLPYRYFEFGEPHLTIGFKGRF